MSLSWIEIFDYLNETLSLNFSTKALLKLEIYKAPLTSFQHYEISSALINNLKALLRPLDSSQTNQSTSHWVVARRMLKLFPIISILRLQKCLLYHNFIESTGNLVVEVINHEIEDGTVVYEQTRIYLVVVFAA